MLSFSLSYNPLFWDLDLWKKNASELGPAWQNIAGKSDIHKQDENGLELFRSRGTLEKLNNLKPLISPNEELYI